MVSEDPDRTVQRAVAGDDAALGELLYGLYDRLARRVDSKLPHSLRRVVGVEDVLQESFVRAYREVRQLERPTKRTFVSWILTIVDHQLIDMIRRANARKRVVKKSSHRPADESFRGLVELLRDSTGDSPSARASLDEAERALRLGLAQLNDAQRAAVQLHFLAGLSLVETAKELGCSKGALRGYLHRAKASLRAHLGRSSKWFEKK